MSNISVFDIMGPVMIGPSSSHTAGAERIGKIARNIAGSEPKEVKFYLHGSFANTYKGHGTDRALVAGILGMEPDDDRIKNSIQIAEEKGMKIEFIETDLGDFHPNTVKIVMVLEDGKTTSVTGSSIGGGNIVITDIDGSKVEFDGKYPVVVVKHRDKYGMISKITLNIALSQTNIATLKVGRTAKGDIATTIIETDGTAPQSAIDEISKIDGVILVRAIEPI